MAKPKRTNRTRQSDAPAQADAPVTESDVTDADLTDDADVEVDGADTKAAAAKKDDAKPAAKDASKDEKKDSAKSSSKSASSKSAEKKPAGRNRKAADSAKSSRSGNPAKRDAAKRDSVRKTASYTSTPGAQTIKPNARWFVPAMVTVLLVGLAWLVTFYLSSGTYPVTAWGYWNLGVGFAILVAGLIMSTRWR